MSTKHAPSVSAGVTTMLVIAFMGVFTLILGTLTSYAFEQSTYGRALFGREQAVHVAEAGLDYYKWFLAHNPSILTNGSGLVSPYTYTVNDPEGGEIGTATITATAATECGVVQWIDLTSEGVANANPGFPRTLSTRFMRSSVAEYSNIINSNVWAGSDRQISGPYFSNGGIRMDGTNNSTVSSAVSSWQCNSSFGCSPTQSKAGVFGGGSGSILWQYPVANIDFTGIATNFATLETYAQSSGMYLSGSRTYVGGVQQGSNYTDVSANDQRGYHLVFNANGTVSVYRVTGTSATYGEHINDSTYYWDYYTITSQTLLGTYTAPTDCSIIFSKARTWVDGTVSGKVTLVVADTGSYSPDLILPNNIAYATTDGTSGFTVIAEHSVLLPPNSPNNMSIRGIFIAQSGYFGRNYYSGNIKNSFTLNGTIVSNQRVGTQWSSGGTIVSGYQNRDETYDRLQAFTPPPFTPTVSTDYHYTLWREQ